MEINSSNIGTIILTISFTGAVIRYFLVQPIQTALSSLKEATENLHNMLDELRSEQHNIDKRLVVVEESAKSAHHRINTIEEVIK